MRRPPPQPSPTWGGPTAPPLSPPPLKADDGRDESILPLATVLAALFAVWYVAAVWMNAPLQRDLFANAGNNDYTTADSSAPRSTWSGPKLPAPHQIATELYKLIVATDPTSKRSLVYHAGITLEETLIGFVIGAALGVGAGGADRLRCACSNAR